MAKPIPWAPPMIAVLIPTTLPEASASGPPELPGFIAASVWMTFSIRRPLSPLIERPSALTTPAVTLRWNPSGLPMATTSCPTARSLGGSSPRTSAGTGDPPESVTSMPPEPLLRPSALLKPRTTWALVTAVAVPSSAPSTTPLPPPRPFGSPTEMTAGSSFSVTCRTAREYASSASCPNRELAERFSKISIYYFYRTLSRLTLDERLGFEGRDFTFKGPLATRYNPVVVSRPLDNARLFAAIVSAQMARLASRTLGTGGGSTVPGVVARRVDPQVLEKLSARLRLGSAAITGTNGKTTTTRMISKILQTAGVRAVNNSTGANLVTGVTAALISDSNLSGKLTSEMGLFEVDEASVPKVAAEAKLDILAVLNLFRDQLDRYGELAYTGRVVASAFPALPEDGSVVLNADDPLVASLGRQARKPVYYGVDEPSLDTGRLQHIADSKDCPICGTALAYDAVYMGHVGVYDCRNCSFGRPELQYKASQVRLDGARRADFLLSTPAGETEVRVNLPGLYNVYNALAAATVAAEAGVGLGEISRGLREFGGAFGRVERVRAGDREAFLLLIKNPVGFNEILRTFVASDDARHVLIAINDNHADGRDVSWLWDVDFEMLADARVEGQTKGASPFMVAGIRANDMAVRLKYADLPVGSVIPDLKEAIRTALEATPPGETLYVLPTYTAMLEIRKTLSELGYTHPFWED